MILLMLLLAASPRELNDAGMKSYRARDYAKAVEHFQKALELDPEDKEAGPSVKEQVERARLRALIHHNLACVQSLMRAKGEVCSTDNYRSAIVEHLRQSVRFDPSRLDRAVNDPDLAAVRDTLGFQSLKGLSISRDADLAALLPRVHWWSPGVGVYGSTNELTFKADGTVESKTKVVSEEGKLLAPKVVTGRWKLDGRKLSIDWRDGKKAGGAINDRGFDLDGTAYSDSPSECDA
ncbi:MAG: tetratricopeptide repeat protein [Archangiaceae bacterium]|nr:tetratricopeptide repeat protein [Archangiaceae bacterium]